MPTEALTVEPLQKQVTQTRDDLAAIVTSYDPIDNEPELDILLRSRRVGGHSTFTFAYAKEGQVGGQLSQTQRDWGVAVLRYIAGLFGQRAVEGEDDSLASSAKLLMAHRAALEDTYVYVVAAMVQERGLREAARAIGLKPGQVSALLRSRRVNLALLTKEMLAEKLKALTLS